MDAKLPVLLDTDLGSDIDDAVALTYLLGKQNCELLGVTTVSGDVQKRAAIAEVILKHHGRNQVPIHCGRRDVLLNGPGQPNVPQFEAIASYKPRLDRPENTAVPFLREAIRARPHEITLLSIGPYSNIALLFALDPEIPYLLKGLVSMGGSFFHAGRNEWNVVCDPTAAAIVYHAPRLNHVSIGLDVTLQCTLAVNEVDELFAAPVWDPVKEMAKVWFKHTDRLTFHDPLAAAVIFAPTLCSYRPGHVQVDTSTGATILVPDKGPDHVAHAVDVARFFDSFR